MSDGDYYARSSDGRQVLVDHRGKGIRIPYFNLVGHPLPVPDRGVPDHADSNCSYTFVPDGK